MTTGVLGTCLTLTGCGGGQTGENASAPAEDTQAAKDAQPPAGFKTVGGEANGVTVAVPESWTALDLTKDDLDQGLAQSGLSGGALRQAKRGLESLVSSKALWASDPASAAQSPDKFATNLNGFCQPSAGETTEQLISSAKSQLGRLDATIDEAAEVPVEAGQAVRVTYTFTSKDVKVRGTQYYVPAGGRTCLVTLSTDQKDKQQLFDQIGKTVRPV
ncbi:hypothetical protein [Microtetraspora sp. NBRC 13810]|uniref:hypothetical protein n=1 Tax=Microtetraspora sp. NBRC 13810 TaxID=3030990 RepID=UPI00255543F5|nr:hypothetical protein [Microtetraspora sp. NBRC 13810]